MYVTSEPSPRFIYCHIYRWVLDGVVIRKAIPIPILSMFTMWTLVSAVILVSSRIILMISWISPLTLLQLVSPEVLKKLRLKKCLTQTATVCFWKVLIPIRFWMDYHSLAIKLFFSVPLELKGKLPETAAKVSQQVQVPCNLHLQGSVSTLKTK